MRNKSKLLLLLLFGILSGSFTFQKQDIGKVIFEGHCMQCHLQNKTTKIAPSFQNIRIDYGEEWAVKFVVDGYKMVQNKDLLALYSYYTFKKVKHTRFPVLEPEVIVAIFDYVDKFPKDSSQFAHRRVSPMQKQKFVKSQIEKDSKRKS